MKKNSASTPLSPHIPMLVVQNPLDVQSVFACPPILRDPVDQHREPVSAPSSDEKRIRGATVQARGRNAKKRAAVAVAQKLAQHLLKRVRPTCTERSSPNKECGWKDGDRGGSAQNASKSKTILTLTSLLMEDPMSIQRKRLF
jgi:hypothetical protein